MLSQVDLWRNGSASDSRSEGCVFDSRQVHILNVFAIFILSALLKKDIKYTPSKYCHLTGYITLSFDH